MNSVRFFSKRVLVFVLLAVWISSVYASAGDRPEAGVVVAVRGKVLAENPSAETRRLVMKAPVYVKDTVKTGQGKVQFKFNDNTLITLGYNTVMVIEEYLYKPDDKESAMKTRVEEGAFRIMGGSITRIAPKNFKTEVPCATIGVRGSMYAGVVEGDVLSLVFQGGRSIYVANQAGRVDITRPGFGTVVRGLALAPEKSRKFRKEELSDIEGKLAAVEKRQTRPGKQARKPKKRAGVKNGARPAPLAGSVKRPSRDVKTGDMTSTVSDKIAEEKRRTLESAAASPAEQKIIGWLRESGSAAFRSRGVPSSGAFIYDGRMKLDDPETTGESGAFYFLVDFKTGRFIGTDDDPESSDIIHNGFVFGEVTDQAALVNVHALGPCGGIGGEKDSDWPDGPTVPNDPSNPDSPRLPGIYVSSGSGVFGHFYGLDRQSLGLAVEGWDVNVKDQSVQVPWSSIMTAQKGSEVSGPAPGGRERWEGFYFGLAEDMDQPDQNRRVFFNSSSEDFSLVLDHDNATVSGSMSGTDLYNSENALQSLKIGGDRDTSVLFRDSRMLAFLGGDGVVRTSSGASALKPHGNFLVMSDKEKMSDYTSWGYWEATYKDPGTSADYHIHVPGSMWIGGKRTPEHAVADLMAAGFQGTYQGGAAGVMLDGPGAAMALKNGETRLNVDFDPAAASPVSGTLTFDSAVLDVTSLSGALNSRGFEAMITGTSRSKVNGAFFGSGAAGVGGNFSAEMPDGVQYHGIFAGDR